MEVYSNWREHLIIFSELYYTITHSGLFTTVRQTCIIRHILYHVTLFDVYGDSVSIYVWLGFNGAFVRASAAAVCRLPLSDNTANERVLPFTGYFSLRYSLKSPICYVTLRNAKSCRVTQSLQCIRCVGHGCCARGQPRCRNNPSCLGSRD